MKFINSLLISFTFLFVLNAAGQTAIHDIQGKTNISPYDRKQVTTRGVVTAVIKRGFFIQTPDADIDKDPMTSEGLFVFMPEVPKEAAIGNLVEVSGTISEFRPPKERYGLTTTEMTRPSVKLIKAGQPLPAPIVLTTADLNAKSMLDQMEKFEGMRVKVDVMNVVGPTGGYENNKTGDYKSDGLFFGVLNNTPRPFREPGIDVLIKLGDKLPDSVPWFDTNPELIRVDSDAQIGSTAIDVTAGANIKNLIGVVDYSYRRYTILVDAATPPVVEGNKTFTRVSPAGERETTVASFNIENFFDDEKNSPDLKKEDVLSKENFQRRLNKASLAIRNVLSMPDVLGVAEVENLIVLKKLADKINADAVADKQPNPNYAAYLEEGNDPRGIDVGFLVKSSKVKVIEVKQLGKDEKLAFKGADPDEKLFDRTPLLIRVEVQDPKTNQPFAETVIMNHLKSYLGIDSDEKGAQTQTKRRLQAEWLANFVAEREKANPAERLFVCGDFNAFQFNDGYNDLIGILKGKSDPNVLSPSTTAYQTGLVNMLDKIAPPNRYSYSHDGSAQAIDHMLLNKPANARIVKFGYARLDADFPKVYSNDAGRPERLSDHDAPVVFLSLDELKHQ
jgi:uncharacterized protein